MPIYQYSTSSNNELEAAFGTSLLKGLTSKSAEERLAKYGQNSLEVKRVEWWQIMLRQFKSAFVYLLLFASVISFFLGEILDGSLILSFIIINAILGFYQEYKSEQTVQLLQSYIQPKVKVIRDGVEVVILGNQLVTGDIIVLETGDIIPADIRFVTEHDLAVDESVLTGESVQIKKTATPIDKPALDIYGATNLGFMGTVVVSGVAHALVVATGKATQMGGISKLTSETTRISGFEKQLNQFSKFILYLILATLLLVFLAHIFAIHARSFTDLLLFMIALAVGVVPEALPLVTTFSLSRGAVNLTKKKVVVKRLSAIEDLGSIEILCSDKTGTLTENKMRVAEEYGEDPDFTLLCATLASSYIGNKTRLANNSFDLSLMQKIGESVKNTLTKYTKVAELPFDPVRRRNSALIKSEGVSILIVRGAAEAILPYTNNLSPEKVTAINNWATEQGVKGHRVLAVAARENFNTDSYEFEDEQHDLKFLGLVSFEDPVKQSTKEAVLKAENMQVKIKILTGDSREVAGAVAYAVGISSSPKDVITGEEFSALEAPAKIRALDQYSVFARVTPEQKYEIIELLQKTYRVGYLGEGINDAPALKIADVALVVEGASDIAREAADIVLLQQNLEVIVNGIEEGRKTFVNTVKYIKSTLASNFGNFYSVAFASLLIPFLPMLPIQILLVNLLSDFPMISVATDSVEPTEMKNPKSYDIKEIILLATILGMVSSLFDFMFFAVFKSMGEGSLQTNWFIGSILTELLLIYSIRTKRAFFRATTMPSVQVTLLTFVAAAATVIIPLTKFGAEIFKFKAPSLNELGLIFGIVALYFATTEVAKLLYYRTIDKQI